MYISEPFDAVDIFLLADCHQALALLWLIRPGRAGIVINTDLHLLGLGG